MLQLLVAEPDQRFERDLITEPVIAAQLQHLGADKALDQSEHAGVGATLYLAEIPLFLRRQGNHSPDEGEPVGQEFVGEIELAATDDIGLDVPADPLRTGNAARVTFAQIIIHSGLLCLF